MEEVTTATATWVKAEDGLVGIVALLLIVAPTTVGVIVEGVVGKLILPVDWKVSVVFTCIFHNTFFFY